MTAGQASQKFWECGRKRPYSKPEAKLALERFKELGETRLRVYNCPHCPFYHLGKKPRREVV